VLTYPDKSVRLGGSIVEDYASPEKGRTDDPMVPFQCVTRGDRSSIGRRLSVLKFAWRPESDLGKSIEK